MMQSLRELIAAFPLLRRVPRRAISDAIYRFNRREREANVALEVRQAELIQWPVPVANGYELRLHLKAFDPLGNWWSSSVPIDESDLEREPDAKK